MIRGKDRDPSKMPTITDVIADEASLALYEEPQDERVLFLWATVSHDAG